MHRRTRLIAVGHEWVQEEEHNRSHEAPCLTVEQAAFLQPGDIIFDNYCEEVGCVNTFVFRYNARHLWARARRKVFPLVYALLWYREVLRLQGTCALSPCAFSPVLTGLAPDGSFN